MIALFILATLSADPGPPAAWSDTVDDGPPVAWSADIPRPASRPVVRTASLRRPVHPEPDPAAAVAIAAWPGPASYSLVDIAGYTWTHADPEYLRRWVADCNEARTRYGVPSVTYSVARPVYAGGFYASYGYSAGSCASGSCARR